MRLRRLIDHNPFLLVSAAFVLAGGYLVAAGEGTTFRLIGLFIFIQLYELALLGAAGFIERWVGRRDPSARRDAATLLALEVLFLGDLSFTNSVFPGAGTTGLELGIDREDLVAPLLAAVVAIVLGPVKLAMASRAGGIQWPRALYGYVVFALAMIHGGPVLVLLLGESSNASGAIGTLWWVAAFLPLVLTRAVAGEGSMGPLPVSRPNGVLALGGALLVAAVAHIVSASWAHVVAFEAWHPSALFLGLAAAWPRLVPSRARALSTAGLSLAAATVALLLASGAGPRETIFLGPFETTPFRAVAILATLALVDAARKTSRPRLLYAAAATGVFAVLGATPRAVDNALLVPDPGTKAALAGVALALTVLKVDHLAAALAGLAASLVLSGDVRNDWLLASLVTLHQLVLAHRQGSAPWLRLRTLLAWATLLTSLGALGRTISLVDLYVVSLVAAAFFARSRGRGCGYEWPASIVGVFFLGDRIVRNAPRERTGVGVLALGAGVAFLGAGLAYSVFRQRLAAWVEKTTAGTQPVALPRSSEGVS